MFFAEFFIMHKFYHSLHFSIRIKCVCIVTKFIVIFILYKQSKNKELLIFYYYVWYLIS